MMKQQLKETKSAPSSKKEVRDQQEDNEVRKEELYLPQAIQDEVDRNSGHGFINPVAGGLNSTP
eukprot:11319223-Prorocentrum_lima.AAC.1